MSVVFVGIAGDRLGLAVLVKGVADRVAYTAGETVRARNPSLPPPNVVCIDAALEEIW